MGIKIMSSNINNGFRNGGIMDYMRLFYNI